MKKILKLLCLLTLVIMISACSNQENENKLQPKQVKVDNTIITLNDNAEDIVNKLGVPQNIEESKSCLFDGNDKVYYYSNIVFSTYPQENNDYINSITILDKDIQLDSEIKIGDNIEQIHDKYGDDTASEDDMTIVYEFDDYGIAFYLEDSIIQQFDLYLLQ